MPELTTNYSLKKPTYSETADIAVINENMDTIDTKLKESADHAGNKENPHNVDKSDVGLSNVDNVKQAQYKNGTGTFPSGVSTYTVTDSFITVNTTIMLFPDGTEEGAWSWESQAGQFVITSDTAESVNVPFEWGAVK